MKKAFNILLFIGLIVISITACKEKDPGEGDLQKDPGQGDLQIKFNHLIDNKEIIYDSMMYVNAAGNPYLVTEVKWFVSRVMLFQKGGEIIKIEENDGIHYIDTKVENTLVWNINQKIEAGDYDSIRFIFGFNETDNIPNRFVNAPETSMAWPLTLGGGFHYMMLNGKFKRSDETIAAMNVHMGKGQIYEGTTSSVDSIISFVHNHFTVTLSKPFTIEKDKTAAISIVMNVENWFQNPHIYDHYQWGSHIMQKQEAMNMVKENGWNVFSMEAK